MYLPYLRGKQFELAALRECADISSARHLKPIIEPVRENMNALVNTIEHLNKCNIVPIVVINPSVGELSGQPSDRITRVLDEYDYTPCILLAGSSDEIAIHLAESMTREFVIYLTEGVDNTIIKLCNTAEFTIINPKISPTLLTKFSKVAFIDDNFKKKPRNADYGSESAFSHWHVTFRDTPNAVGFGDYTIMGTDFSESGGPAYVVTIHLSYINTEQYDEMYVKHYSSYDDNTPTNPGGKFIDALGSAVKDIIKDPSIFYETLATREFISLYENRHYPGLGQIKKLSIMHHIETLCDYLEG